eukprot:scaffold11152_cov18-Prasinocladus_malaysianus.AAC.1
MKRVLGERSCKQSQAERTSIVSQTLKGLRLFSWEVVVGRKSKNVVTSKKVLLLLGWGKKLACNSLQ